MRIMELSKKIGILGGGQLGKMLCEAGLPWHLDISILDKSDDFPASPYSNNFVEGDFSNYEDVINFGSDKDVLTIEIESVNTDALKVLESQGIQVFPQPHIIELIQDKGAQKRFYEDNGFPTSSFQLCTEAELVSSEFLKGLKLPFVQKLRKGGYDGKGVQIVKTLSDLMPGRSVLEDLIDIEKEISVIVARDVQGHVVAYDVVEMVFDPIGNLVDHLIAPADLSQKQNDEATELAKSLITSLGMVGLLAVEMFLTKDGHLLINEVAPRPHNSGHHTIENTDCSQYEQLLRCLIQAPLIPGIGHRPAMMINILGGPHGVGKPRYNGIDEIMTITGVHLFLYGKKETRPFRKLGHFTIVGENKADLIRKANIIKSKFSVSCE